MSSKSKFFTYSSDHFYYKGTASRPESSAKFTSEDWVDTLETLLPTPSEFQNQNEIGAEEGKEEMQFNEVVREIIDGYVSRVIGSQEEEKMGSKEYLSDTQVNSNKISSTIRVIKGHKGYISNFDSYVIGRILGFLNYKYVMTKVRCLNTSFMYF